MEAKGGWLIDPMATKIMFLVDRYDGPQAGSEGQLLQLIQYLDRSRYEPFMTLLRGGDKTTYNSFPCPVRVLGIAKLMSVRSIVRMVGYALALRREGVRIVHCFLNDSAVIAPPFLRLFGIRVLVSRRDMGFWHTRLNLVALRMVAPFVNCYVANSEAVKKLVEIQEGVPRGRIRVIYNGYSKRVDGKGVDGCNTDPLGLPEHVPVVGIVANLKPIKRIDTLVEAFARVRDRYPDARLVVVGDTASRQGGQTLEALKEMAGRLGIGDGVIFAGRVEDPSAYIRRFSVAVLCSESEGFSNSIIEYMHARRPVVCTDTGGNPELVKDNHNGFLVPVGDSVALAERIVRILSDRALARRFGEAAYEAVRTAYTHERMVSEQMACYDQVLSEVDMQGA